MNIIYSSKRGWLNTEAQDFFHSKKLWVSIQVLTQSRPKWTTLSFSRWAKMHDWMQATKIKLIRGQVLSWKQLRDACHRNAERLEVLLKHSANPIIWTLPRFLLRGIDGVNKSPHEPDVCEQQTQNCNVQNRLSAVVNPTTAPKACEWIFMSPLVTLHE